MRATLLLCLALTSCTSSYVRRMPGATHGAPRPTLLLHASVTQENTDEGTGHLSTTALSQDRRVGAFGETVIGMIEPMLASHGFVLQIDTERAQQVHDINWTDAWSVRVAPMWNSLNLVSTAWVDPRGAQIGGLTTDNLTRGTEYSRIAERLNPDGTREGYVFIVVRVMVETHLLLIRAPQIRVNLFVADEHGREVFRAQGIGNGLSRFMSVDRSKENLSRGLANAIAAMQEAPPRNLRFRTKQK
jgi:hypothetical protein